MDKRRVWLSPRALKLHAVILIVVPTFLALCAWQITRALGGNSLSWAYVFEWPIFAGYAVYMWWRFVHEAADTPPASTDGQTATPTTAKRDTPAGACQRRRTRRKRTRRRRTRRRRTRRRRTTRSAKPPSWPPTTSTWRSWRSGTRPPGADGRTGVPGGGLEPPTSGSKGRRSAD